MFLRIQNWCYFYYKARFESKGIMFQVLCCDTRSKPAELETAHLDITEAANPYNKEEYTCHMEGCV